MARKNRILLVDDEELILDMLGEALTADDVEVHKAHNGRDAIELFEERTFDVVLTDILMPNMSGAQLVPKLKMSDPFIQIIVMTGYPTLEKIATILECGASDFIIKPFKLDNVHAIVQENIVRSKRWRDVRKIWLERKANIKE